MTLHFCQVGEDGRRGLSGRSCKEADCCQWKSTILRYLFYCISDIRSDPTLVQQLLLQLFMERHACQGHTGTARPLTVRLDVILFSFGLGGFLSMAQLKSSLFARSSPKSTLNACIQYHDRETVS